QMKLLWAGSLLSLTACLLAGCSNDPGKPVEQSVLVTAANETAALTRLRAIADAERRYQVESGGAYAPLDQLIQKGYVNDPSRGKLTGYRFDVKVKAGSFQATAVPEKFGVSGTRSFYVDELNVVHGANKKGAEATGSDPEV
ncbi:MAG TPA: hypothetical protein VK747_12360, partial [Blastocatellia bacterium]|nr:hypothetical protein [Blastocatellia bacterium]